MSVTGHRDVRQADDSYATPEWCTRLLLPYLQRGDVLDPCCGAGAIGKVVFEAWSEDHTADLSIHGIEINGQRAGEASAGGYFDAVVDGDYLHHSTGRHYPLIITNPPFSLAMPFLQKALQEADTVAFLLRLAWLSSAERNAFHRENPSDLIVLPRRPSFAKFASCSDKSIDIEAPPDPVDLSIPLKCGWNQVYKPSETPPKKCPKCGAKVKVASSDSSDYGWFIWGPGRAGRIIHPPPSAFDVAAINREFDGAAAELEALTR